MSTVSISDVKKLAALSALSVNDEEAQKLAVELDEIIKYVEQLDSVDTEGLEPTYQVTGLKNVTRADEEIDYGVTPANLLKNVPDQENNQIKVKRVIE